MKKLLRLRTMLLLCALIAGGSSVWADTTITKTMSQIVSGNGYTVSAGNSATCYTSFELDDNITISTTGTPNCGSFWGTSPNIDWRLYQNQSGNVTITAGEGCTLKSVIITYSVSNNGTLKDGSTTIASASEQTLSGTSKTYTVGNTSTKTNGQVRITSISVTYEESASEGTTASPTISGEETFFTTRTVTITNAASADGADIYYTLNGDDPTTTTSATCFKYSGAFEVSATTTVKAIAKHADDTNASSVVSKTFTKAEVLEGLSGLTAKTNTSDASYYVNLTNAQVTYVTGSNGFMEDATTGIYIYNASPVLNKMYNGIFEVTYQVYSSLPELKAISAVDGEGATITDGATKAASAMTLSQLAANYSANLGRQLVIAGVEISNASKLTDDIALSTYGDVTITAGKTYTLTGYPYMYRGSKQFNVVSAVEKTLADNAISGLNDAYTIDMTQGEEDLTFSATATSGATVLFEIVSEGTTVSADGYELEGNYLLVSKKGTIKIRAYVDADEEYKAAEKVITITVIGEKDAPVFDIDNQTVAYLGTYTVSAEDYITDGAVSLASSNTAVATVEGLTVTAVAVGTATITVSAAEGTEYKAGNTTFTVTVTAPEGKTTAPVAGTTTTFTDKNLNYSEGIAWTANKGANSFDTQNDRGVQFGAAIGEFTLKASAGALTKVSMVMSTNGTGNTVAVSVGGTNFTTGNSETLTLNNGIKNETVEFVGTGSGEVVISVNDANRSVYFKSITLTSAVTAPSVKLNGSGYATYCSEYPLDFTEAEGYTAWQITDIDNDAITFAKVTGSVKGGTGLLLKGEAGATVTLAYTKSETTLSDNLLEGTLAPTCSTGSNYYGLSGKTFVPVGAGTVPAGKALLSAEWIPTQARQLSFIFEDETTGITDHLRETITNNGEYFNLAGQRVAQPAKGLYIVNGRKVVIR